MQAHVPKEEDEWMQFEMKHLPQFTRIFPVVESTNKSSSDLTEQEAAELEAKEEEEEENDKDDGEGGGSVPTGNGKGKDGKNIGDDKAKVDAYKIQSFVDILLQVLASLLCSALY